MTTNATVRIRSKSITNLFAATPWEEDEEELLPENRKNDKKSAFEKWKSSMNLNLRNNDQQQGERRTSRGNFIFSRPPAPTQRRQSLAVTFRRPSVIKDDLKKMWENRRSSLSNLKTQLKDRITGRSNDNLSTNRNQSVGSTRIEDEMESQYEDEGMPPPFFIVDRSAWNRPRN